MAVGINYYKTADGITREVKSDEDWDTLEIFIGARLHSHSLRVARLGSQEACKCIASYLTQYYLAGFEHGRRDKLKEIKAALQIP